MRSLRLALTLAVLLGVAACGGGGGSPVPSSVRQQVRAQAGSIDFLPTQLPRGYSFQDWRPGGAAGFDLFFSRPSGEQIGFNVVRAPCQSNGAPMHTFQANGVAVKWSATYEDQQAWRCLTVNGTDVLVQASRSVPGDDSLRTPQQRQDAEEMVDLVAHAGLAQ